MSIPAAEVLPLGALVTPTPQGIASRVLARTGGGNLTLFMLNDTCGNLLQVAQLKRW